jgi:heme exporter protein A
MSGRPPEDPVDFDVIEIHDVSRHFGRRRALARVSLEARAGRVIGLVGPNGAGKSTLLAVLSTLAQPTSGEVRYGGRTARQWGDGLRSRIGMVGHDLFLYGDLSARENLEFFGRLYGVPEIGRRVERALGDAGLTERSHDRVAGFSRGLRQRLALERALLHGPRLVLLDEPFTGLDDRSASQLAARLEALRAGGAIVVMATHDFESADAVIDDAVCLCDGRLLPMETAGGTLRERYRRAVVAASR